MMEARMRNKLHTHPIGLTTLLSTLFAAMFLVISTITFCVRGVGENNQTDGVGTSSKRDLPIYSVDLEEKKIAISFDCAWGIDHTDTLLSIMKEHNIRCTFFAVQFWVEKYPEYAKKIVDMGHELGTHSHTHSYMSKQSVAEIKDELTTSSQAIERVTGQKVTLFRPPYGDYDNDVIQTSLSLGIYPIQWDVDSLDWKNLSANEIALRIVNGAKPGSIILCHNNGMHTAEALPILFTTLKNRGFTFVPIGELIYKENYYIDHNGKQIQNKSST